MNTRNIHHISYILSQFPETHETFIVREIAEMRRQGVQIEIFSLKKCRDKVVQKEAIPLKEITYYPDFQMFVQAFWILLYFSFVHPLRLGQIVARLLQDNLKNPLYLVKTMAMVPVGIWIGWKSKRLGSTHLHAHWATVPTETAWITSHAWKIPYSFTAHAWDIFLHPGNLTRLIEASTRVITCTKFNKEFLLQNSGLKFADKIAVVYHGMNFLPINPFGEVKNGALNILAVGRLVEQKGFNYLILALKELQHRGEKATLWLVGEGPLRASLETLAQKLGVLDWIDFKGILPQEEVFSLMRRATVFVMPSVVAHNQDRDGIPNVLIEAMAHGLPVVGTNVSGLPEVVQEGVTGKLVPPESPQSLAEAILFLKKNPQEAQRLAQEGQKLVFENFDVRKNVSTMREKLGLVGL